jgi:acyl-CoA synthetase (AMP-forming)/AMP-acid ligase II
VRLFDSLDYFARMTPDALFARSEESGGISMTYAEAAAASRRIANGICARGLEQGDRVAFLAKNRLDLVLLYFGATRAGVVPVPLNYRLAPPEWSYILGDSGARAIFATADLARALEPVRAELTSIEHYFALDSNAEDCPKSWEPYPNWFAAQSDAPCPRTIEESDDAYQMYTSGTTGRPKGAVIAHSAITANIVQVQHGLHASASDCSLVVAPLYHAAACIVAFVAISQGGSLYIQEDFVPREAVRAMSEEGISKALLVPAMIQACLVAVPDVADRNYDALTSVVYGASPIAEETLRQAMKVFGCGFMQGYGMTETSAVLTNLLPVDHEIALAPGGRPELLLSAGRAVVGTELRIVDEDDQPVPNGTIGEIVGRGPQLMRGYWNLPEATEAALLGGWMHTGDAGILNDEGYLFIQDRVKDMIVSGGENIYPREVEDALYAHEAVAEAAVIGVPDKKFGEAVKAIVVLKDGASATAEELVEFCRERLAGFKQPRSVDFIAELPRNPSGKVLKRELREPYWADQNRQVS